MPSIGLIASNVCQLEKEDRKPEGTHAGLGLSWRLRKFNVSLQRWTCEAHYLKDRKKLVRPTP